jgi:hypothetical protein
MQARSSEALRSVGMAGALVAAVLVCVASAADVTVRVPQYVEAPLPEVDCTPAGIEVTQATVARIERQLIIERDDLAFVRWATAEAVSQRRALRACGASQRVDHCFDLRRKMVVEPVDSSWSGGLRDDSRYWERVRDNLRACERRDYTAIHPW